VILALDVGNTQIFGGIFQEGALAIRFRASSRPPTSSDELGLFLRNVLRENGSDPARVDQVAFCSVVPEIIYPLRSCCRKYFGVEPFVLQAGAKTGLKIRYRNPLEVGPDRIANAIAATHLYPDRNLVIVGCGTATTFDVIRAGRDFLAGSSSRVSGRRWKRSRRRPRGCPMSRSSRPPSWSVDPPSSASSRGCTSVTAPSCAA